MKTAIYMPFYSGHTGDCFQASLQSADVNKQKKKEKKLRIAMDQLINGKFPPEVLVD